MTVGRVVEVLWARHGQNVANLTRTFSYRIFDGDLTALGRQQAQDLAELLATGDPVGQLVCSPLRRARQTAEIVGQRLGLPVAMELDDLREVNVGELDGRSDPAAWDIYAQVLAAWQEGETGARFPGGEDYGELCARLRRALATVARSPGVRGAGVRGADVRGAGVRGAGVRGAGVRGAGVRGAGVRGAGVRGAGQPRGALAGTDRRFQRSLVVAHGANLRAALPGLAGQPDPGADLPTGGAAELRVDLSSGGPASVRLLSWPGRIPSGPDLSQPG